MAKVGVLVCFVIVSMDIAAGILGIQAQLASNKFHEYKKGVDMDLRSLKCKVPSREAFMLGLVATVLFALSHISANLLGGCICIASGEAHSTRRRFWMACLISTWIIMGIGFPMLINGVVENSDSRGPCRMLQYTHYLSTGGILCFLHSIFLLAFYVLAST